VAGGLEAGRAARDTLLALPDAVEVALREDSVFSADRVGADLVLRLDAGSAWVDHAAPLALRTPHASVTSARAGLVVVSGPKGTAVTVIHGTATVAGSPFRQEISREEAVDVSPDGLLGRPIRLDPSAAAAWATALREKASLLPNGGFEQDFQGWEPGRYAEARVRLDRRAHAGRQAALVEFNAVRDYEHETPASAPLSVRPGGSYRFTGYVEYADLEVGPGGGILLEVRGPPGPAPFRRATPAYQGHSGWIKFSLEFELPPDTPELRVLLTRIRNGAATQGRFRLDELALFDLGR
jgi:hypothetical protein